MKILQDLNIFRLTAKLGSLSQAARELELTPAATSAAVKRLEADINVVLFVRSTRQLRLTHEGEVFLQNVEQALELLDGAVHEIQNGYLTVSGLLHLSVPSDLGRNTLLPWLDEFQSLYPEVRVQLELSDRLTDIYSKPIEFALRYGEPANSNLIALTISRDNERILCASPDYIAAYGEPQSPEELVEHNCLCFKVGDYLNDRWHFWQQASEKSVVVRGNRTADDGDAVRRWAVAGKGIAYKSKLDIVEDLAQGRLVHLCPQWRGEFAPLNLICSDRRMLTPSVKALQAFLQNKCKLALANKKLEG